jgi:hypothetical protein
MWTLFRRVYSHIAETVEEKNNKNILGLYGSNGALFEKGTDRCFTI